MMSKNASIHARFLIRMPRGTSARTMPQLHCNSARIIGASTWRGSFSVHMKSMYAGRIDRIRGGAHDFLRLPRLATGWVA